MNSFVSLPLAPFWIMTMRPSCSTKKKRSDPSGASDIHTGRLNVNSGKTRRSSIFGRGWQKAGVTNKATKPIMRVRMEIPLVIVREYRTSPHFATSFDGPDIGDYPVAMRDVFAIEVAGRAAV